MINLRIDKLHDSYINTSKLNFRPHCKTQQFPNFFMLNMLFMYLMLTSYDDLDSGNVLKQKTPVRPLQIKKKH